MDRRAFLASAAACAAAPLWAEVGGPDYLTAAATPDHKTWLLGLTRTGTVVFSRPIPARGHAAAAHPTRAEAVAFARRPGTFAVVMDCATGDEIARLTSPEGRHFYGHGAYTSDGAYLLTTENDYTTPDGRLGVWDVAAGYRRVDELPSGGIGPHEIIRLPSGGFAVANGGIQTHPDLDRAKLNLPTMQTGLAWLDDTGVLTHTTPAPEPMRQNSIRHIASDGTGRVVAALQWQGDPREAVPLMAIITRDEITYHPHPDQARIKHYGGSVALSADGARIAVTGPKGGHVLIFDGATGAPRSGLPLPLASGVAQDGANGLIVTHEGGLMHLNGRAELWPVTGNWVFDNHLIKI